MRTLTMILTCLILALPAMANPVPEDVAERFRELVRETAAGSCPDREALVREFGRFGLDLLTEEDRAAIREHFDRFAPILVDGQRPNHELSHDIEMLFLELASESQLAAYRDALLEWLTEPIDSAPASGSMIILYPEDELPRVIGRHRAAAAEILADLGDERAARAIQALLEEHDLDDESRRSLERSLQRLDDPCSVGILRPTPGGSFIVCIEADDIVSVAVDGIDVHREEIDAFAALLSDADTLPRREGGCCSGSIELVLADGTRGRLFRSMRPGWFMLEEDGSMVHRLQWILASTDLWEWHESFRTTHL